ncbi:hypothetical protein OQA88_12851 [Cercophora sp. LCS_1]
MLGRSSAWKKATSVARASFRTEQGRPKCPSSTAPSHRLCLSADNGARLAKTNGAARGPTSAEAKHKRELDREFLISVLESSATKRDAKAYLQTFGGKPIRAVNETPRFIQGPLKEPVIETDDAPHIAIVKLRDPQAWDDTLVDGVARTLTQLRDLGLLSVIVPDSCGASKEEADGQTNRILEALGRHGSPGAQLVNSGISSDGGEGARHLSSLPSGRVFVGAEETITNPLRYGHILVVPPRALSEDTLGFNLTNADDVILALTGFFSGLQLNAKKGQTEPGDESSSERPAKRALVDRIIVIDPLGGIPNSHKNDGARVFINMEEEFEGLQTTLSSGASPGEAGNNHLGNLKLAKSTLAMLPSTASAVITSPTEAANLRPSNNHTKSLIGGRIPAQVGTRRWQNPLIHNLLTDRPIYSSSLPIGRIKPATHGAEAETRRMPTTTLAKRGLPVTTFPDPRSSPWSPPVPGSPRLRLTDTCIDLPRLVHLINDSFGRKLDVEHYLNRVHNSLAGVIVAGEYEGAAILTWERPFGLSEEEAYSQGRLVPYLDKFAVLKRSQGAGGVADIVFNAMVRDCFPGGLCWRSRKNNPVNKWYFERSAGVRKLPDSTWAMFWTSPSASLDERLMQDFEKVCRNVEPSWQDGKQD